jgi:hypothetical protein
MHSVASVVWTHWDYVQLVDTKRASEILFFASVAHMGALEVFSVLGNAVCAVMGSLDLVTTAFQQSGGESSDPVYELLDVLVLFEDIGVGVKNISNHVTKLSDFLPGRVVDNRDGAREVWILPVDSHCFLELGSGKATKTGNAILDGHSKDLGMLKDPGL